MGNNSDFFLGQNYRLSLDHSGKSGGYLLIHGDGRAAKAALGSRVSGPLDSVSPGGTRESSGGARVLLRPSPRSDYGWCAPF